MGNGGFAFGVDVTGLQTFYGNTMSDWSWHSLPLPDGQKPSDLKLTAFDVHGRTVGYPTEKEGQEAIYSWLRNNPHRFNLGRLSMKLTDKKGEAGVLADIREIHQELDLWRGVILSRFHFDDEEVSVRTTVDPASDTIAVSVASKLLADGRLTFELAFPYGSAGLSGAEWRVPNAHTTTLETNQPCRVVFHRTLDSTQYDVRLAWEGQGKISQNKPHFFVLSPVAGTTTLAVTCRFEKLADPSVMSAVANVEAASAKQWERFWMEGGAVDLSLSRDPRWKELERRIVLSQYLLAVQCAGSTPPQESGLYNNGWAGKFHLEMQLWHQAQFALWNRWPLFERSLGWYTEILPSAREKAESQGYTGARWPKMVAPNGVDSPSATGPLLIWQQPHPIFYAELDYRLHPTKATLEKWAALIDASAEFMASFAWLNPASGKYDLGPPIKTVPETTQPLTTFNPAFELSYWRFGLRKAQEWRARLGLPRKPEWDKVAVNLAPLPQADGVYLSQEGMTNTYTRFKFGHPSLIGMLGLLPGDGVDPAVMRATVKKVFEVWNTKNGFWGWDPPLMAMAAARNGEPALAVDALMMDVPRNQFKANGGSTGGPYPYFPSNGGLLYAIAFMAAGWDGAPERHTPGFPSDETWNVRFENLRKAP